MRWGWRKSQQKLNSNVKCRCSGRDFSGGTVTEKLGITPQVYVNEGESVEAGALLLSAVDSADKLQQAWKVVQLVLEWSCGVAQYTAEMIANAKAINPHAVVACTRKVFRIPANWQLMQCWLLAGIFIVKA